MRRFSLPLSLSAILMASLVSAQPSVIGGTTSPRNANYSINARLDPASRTITGSEIITWRNITTKTVTDLQFHLYWNAWKNDKSTFMRERGLRNLHIRIAQKDAGLAAKREIALVRAFHKTLRLPESQIEHDHVNDISRNEIAALWLRVGG